MAGPQPAGGASAPIGFSPQAWKIAAVTGTDTLINRLVTLETEKGPELDWPNIAMLELRQELSDRLLIVSLDISSVSAELHCEMERAGQLAHRLEDERNTRVTHMTIFAILGGALVGILSGGLSLAGEQTAAAAGAISGGVLETAFGTAALFYEPHHEFGHHRNLLREIWEAPSQAMLFPPSVWGYLTQRSSESLGGQSELEIIFAQWRQTGRLGESSSEAERRAVPIFFTDGGNYTIEELRQRAAMLEVIRTRVDLMSQDLNLLIREIFLRASKRSSP